MDKKQKRWLLLSIAISLAFLFGFLFFTIDVDTLKELQNANIWILLLALVMHLFGIGFWAMRIKAMSKSLGYKVPFFHSYNLVCSNQFIAAVTPSQIGGEPVRIYELTKVNVPGGTATAIILLERVFDGVILVLGAIVGVLLLNLGLDNIELPAAYLVTSYAAITILAALVVAFIIVSRKPEFGQRVSRKITEFFLAKFKKKWDDDRKRQTLSWVEAQVDRFYRALNHFLTRSRKGLFYGLFWTAMYWVAEFLMLSVIMMGLGLEPHFILTFVLMIFVTVIMMIPLTPGGSGIAEVSVGAFFALLVPTNLLGIFVLIWRLIVYYFNLLTGFIATLLILRREAKGKEFVRK